jgi:hypothetical protein
LAYTNRINSKRRKPVGECENLNYSRQIPFAQCTDDADTSHYNTWRRFFLQQRINFLEDSFLDQQFGTFSEKLVQAYRQNCISGNDH